MAAPQLQIEATGSPRLLHDLIARDSLEVVVTGADGQLRLSPLAQLRLGQEGLATAEASLRASRLLLPADHALVAVEADTEATQPLLAGRLEDPLHLQLQVNGGSASPACGIMAIRKSQAD
jgi:hypothetical protein